MNILQKIVTFNKTNKTVINICEKYSKSILGVDHIAFRSLYKGMNKFDTTIYEKKMKYIIFLNTVSRQMNITTIINSQENTHCVYLVHTMQANAMMVPY